MSFCCGLMSPNVPKWAHFRAFSFLGSTARESGTVDNGARKHVPLYLGPGGERKGRVFGIRRIFWKYFFGRQKRFTADRNNRDSSEFLGAMEIQSCPGSRSHGNSELSRFRVVPVISLQYAPAQGWAWQCRRPLLGGSGGRRFLRSVATNSQQRDSETLPPSHLHAVAKSPTMPPGRIGSFPVAGRDCQGQRRCPIRVFIAPRGAIEVWLGRQDGFIGHVAPSLPCDVCRQRGPTTPLPRQ